MLPAREIPALPLIGHPESYYARQVHFADKTGDEHLRQSAKVGQYVTLALDPHLEWRQKLRYFEHALHRHCCPPELASEHVWLFYTQLRDLVRQYAGQEALRLASKKDDEYAERVRLGESPSEIGFDARNFFRSIMGQENRRPEHFSEEDWEQLCLLRSQWI